jgi:hypothetical protein
MRPIKFCGDRVRACACLYCVAQFPFVVVLAPSSMVTNGLSGSLGLVALYALLNGRATIDDIIRLLVAVSRSVRSDKSHSTDDKESPPRALPPESSPSDRGRRSAKKLVK